MKKGDIIDLEIESIAFGGAGVGRHAVDERQFVVFVDGTVPGDKVKAKIGGKKRSHAFGYIEEFIHRADNRITPKCKHFGNCGGCSLQYLSYQDQLLIKEQNVKDAISRIGGLDEDKVLPTVGCKSPWNYRNKMEFSFSRSEDGELSLGLHVKRRHYDVVELTECFLFEPYVGDLVAKVRDFFRNLDGKGVLKEGPKLMSLVVRQGKNTGEIMVNLIAENGEAVFLEDFLSLILEFFNGNEDIIKVGRELKSVFYTHIHNQKGSRKKISEHMLWGNSTINEILKIEDDISLKFKISPQAFFQPNTLQSQELYKIALNFADLSGKETVYDLYCGIGTISLLAAHKAAFVYGIELNEPAILNAKSNMELNNIKNVEFVIGDVGKNLSFIPKKPDVVIIDPPRSGLNPDVVDHISSLKPGKIVYVSCNPTTLARDLSLFAKTGYNLIQVQPVDMFPQTYHIECVALLSL